jgi:hypothetical protein
MLGCSRKEPDRSTGGELHPELFLSGKSIGEALLTVRRTLLRELNPLGLVYTLYGAAELGLISGRRSRSRMAPDQGSHPTMPPHRLAPPSFNVRGARSARDHHSELLTTEDCFLLTVRS